MLGFLTDFDLICQSTEVSLLKPTTQPVFLTSNHCVGENENMYQCEDVANQMSLNTIFEFE